MLTGTEQIILYVIIALVTIYGAFDIGRDVGRDEEYARGTREAYTRGYRNGLIAAHDARNRMENGELPMRLARDLDLDT